MRFSTDQVTQALAARQVSTQCPRCTTPDAFDVVDGLVYTEVVGAQDLSHAALVCRRCGHLALHSLEVLGLDG